MASIKFGRYAPTQINAADWAALEEAGCVFLPSALIRSYDGTGLKMDDPNAANQFYYHSATASNASQTARLYIPILYYTSQNWDTNGMNKYGGIAVRLVQDL